MLVRRALGDPADENFVHEAFDIFIRHYREHTLDNTYAYEGMIEALRAIRRQTNGNVAMAVLTNKPVSASQRIVKGLGMEDLFVRVYGGNSFATKKPDPLGALTLLRETSTEPGEAVMIGDSQNDVLTARNSGMWAVGVTYGFSPDSLKSPAPDVLIDSPHELVEALGYGSHRKSLEIPSGQGFAG
jgi:phosphoglycolate phosphatase